MMASFQCPVFGVVIGVPVTIVFKQLWNIKLPHG
jgi:hypothetical protein